MKHYFVALLALMAFSVKAQTFEIKTLVYGTTVAKAEGTIELFDDHIIQTTPATKRTKETKIKMPLLGQLNGYNIKIEILENPFSTKEFTHVIFIKTFDPFTNQGGIVTYLSLIHI